LLLCASPLCTSTLTLAKRMSLPCFSLLNGTKAGQSRQRTRELSHHPRRPQPATNAQPRCRTHLSSSNTGSIFLDGPGTPNVQHPQQSLTPTPQTPTDDSSASAARVNCVYLPHQSAV
jgi:hypothetical protein